MLTGLAIAVHRLRVKRGWSQSRAARAVGITLDELRSVECGYTDPDLRLLEKLAELLDSSLYQLLLAAESIQELPPLQFEYSRFELKLRQQRERLGLQHAVMMKQAARLIEQQNRLMQREAADAKTYAIFASFAKLTDEIVKSQVYVSQMRNAQEQRELFSANASEAFAVDKGLLGRRLTLLRP